MQQAHSRQTKSAAAPSATPATSATQSSTVAEQASQDAANGQNRPNIHIFPKGDAPEQLEDGLWRIPVPLPFALRSANVYLLREGPSDWTMVDAALGLRADERALRAGMEQAGVALTDITALILTHAHPDHIGLSGEIARASGAPVYILEGEDDRLYRVWGGDEAETLFAQLAEYYRVNGLPAELIEQVQSGSQRMRGILKLPRREQLRILHDAETLHLGAHRYEVTWTPGHSDFHMCLLRDDGVFVAGDHVLPGITPNIGLYPNARPDPLRDYFDGLARVRDLSARLVLPGHRRPLADLAGRVDELRAHHEERGETLLGILAEFPEGAPAATLSSALFGQRLTTADDLRFALAETLAHLEYLRSTGRIHREERDEFDIYEIGA